VDDILRASANRLFDLLDYSNDELERASYYLAELREIGFKIGLFDILMEDIRNELRIREHGSDNNYDKVL